MKLITRVLHEDGNVYYRIKDLKKLFLCSEYKLKKSIKESNVEMYKIDFGRTMFIKECDIDKIKIKTKTGIVMRYMKTVFKDFISEVKENVGFESLGGQLFKQIEKSELEIKQNSIMRANETLDNFSETTDDNKDDTDEHMKVFNKYCKEQGFAERIHKLRLLINNKRSEVKYLYLLVGENKNILAECSYFGLSLEYFIEDLEDGYFNNDTDSDLNKIKLKKGEPCKTNERELLAQIVRLASKSVTDQSWVDQIEIILANEEILSVDSCILHAILFNKLSILKNDLEEELLSELNYNENMIYNVESNTNTDNEVIDVEWSPVIENEIIDVDYVEVIPTEVTENENNDFISEEEKEMLCKKALPSIFRTGVYISEEKRDITPEFLVELAEKLREEQENNRLKEIGIDNKNMIIDYDAEIKRRSETEVKVNEEEEEDWLNDLFA